MMPVRLRGLSRDVLDEIVDAGFVAALLTLALLGFRSTYGDFRYLVAGLVGVGLGLAVATVGARKRAPLVVVAAVSVVVFLLFGSAVALRGMVSAGALPSRAGLEALLDGALNGWHELVTVLPPVGAAGNVLAIPYLLGLSGSVLAYTMARRSRLPFLPVLAPVAVLALSILFGDEKPVAVVLQGALFAGLSLGWIALRSRARGETIVRSSSYRRRVSGAVLVAAAATGSIVVGPLLPLAAERVVLRNYVDPPLDLRDYVSPLSTYRKYAVPANKSGGRGGLGDQTLFTVEGLPPGALVRIATMDAYDGTVWNVAGNAAPVEGAEDDDSGAFQRVGETIPTDATGARAQVTFTVGALGGIWLPTVGVARRVEFAGTNADYLAKTFRYNRTTESAVAATLPVDEPLTLQPGDRYTIDAILRPTGLAVPQVDRAALAAAGPGAHRLPEPARIPDAVKAKVAEVVGDAQGTYARVEALAQELGRGAYSNGTEGELASLAGHYAARIERMVSDPQGLVGDAEQYAAAMALMARHLGIPARVVVGVKPLPDTPARREVKGTDVTAWVEVALDGVGWLPVFPTPPSTAKKPQTIPRPKPITRVQEPPRAPVPPRVVADPLTSAGEPTERKAAEKKASTQAKPPERDPVRRNRSVNPVVAGIGAFVGLVVAIVLTLLGLKFLRGRRRRRRGPPSTRIASGWAELIDVARDAGVPMAAVGTRREVAASIGVAEVLPLARRADQAVFAPGEPSEAEVADYWADVDTARSRLTVGQSPWRRVVAALNPRSLRRSG